MDMENESCTSLDTHIKSLQKIPPFSRIGNSSKEHQDNLSTERMVFVPISQNRGPDSLRIIQQDTYGLSETKERNLHLKDSLSHLQKISYPSKDTSGTNSRSNSNSKSFQRRQERQHFHSLLVGNQNQNLMTYSEGTSKSKQHFFSKEMTKTGKMEPAGLVLSPTPTLTPVILPNKPNMDMTPSTIATVPITPSPESSDIMPSDRKVTILPTQDMRNVSTNNGNTHSKQHKTQIKKKKNQWDEALQIILKRPALLTSRVFQTALSQDPPLSFVHKILDLQPNLLRLKIELNSEGNDETRDNFETYHQSPSKRTSNTATSTALQVALAAGAKEPLLDGLLQLDPSALHAVDPKTGLDPLSYARKFRSKETNVISLLEDRRWYHDDEYSVNKNENTTSTTAKTKMATGTTTPVQSMIVANPEERVKTVYAQAAINEDIEDYGDTPTPFISSLPSALWKAPPPPPPPPRTQLLQRSQSSLLGASSKSINVPQKVAITSNDRSLTRLPRQGAECSEDHPTSTSHKTPVTVAAHPLTPSPRRQISTCNDNTATPIKTPTLNPYVDTGNDSMNESHRLRDRDFKQKLNKKKKMNASMIDRQELDNMKLLCATVWKKQQKLAKQVQNQEIDLWKKLQESQQKQARITLIALDMKEKAHEAKLERVVNNCQEKCQHELEKWKTTTWTDAKTEFLSECEQKWKTFQDNSLDVNVNANANAKTKTKSPHYSPQLQREHEQAIVANTTTHNKLTEYKLLLDHEIALNEQFRKDVGAWIEQEFPKAKHSKQFIDDIPKSFDTSRAMDIPAGCKYDDNGELGVEVMPIWFSTNLGETDDCVPLTTALSSNSSNTSDSLAAAKDTHDDNVGKTLHSEDAWYDGDIRKDLFQAGGKHGGDSMEGSTMCRPFHRRKGGKQQHPWNRLSRK